MSGSPRLRSALILKKSWKNPWPKSLPSAQSLSKPSKPVVPRKQRKLKSWPPLSKSLLRFLTIAA